MGKAHDELIETGSHRCYPVTELMAISVAVRSYFCRNLAFVTIVAGVLYFFPHNTGAALKSVLGRTYFGYGIMTDAFGEDLWKLGFAQDWMFSDN